ncbi:MAK10-like protein [Tanacetum coccineum]
MTTEVDARPSSPTLMTSALVVSESQKREVTRNPQITTQTPTNLVSNIVSTSRTQPITLVHPDMQMVDEAFVMANYSLLEPLVRRQMNELWLRGVVTPLKYSIKDIDEEIQMEGPHGIEWSSNPYLSRESPVLQVIVTETLSHWSWMVVECWKTTWDDLPVVLLDGRKNGCSFGHLEELHVTWAHLEKKRTRLRTYANISQDNVLAAGDGVTDTTWRRHNEDQDGVTRFHDGVLENQLLSVSLLICLGKHDCIEKISSVVPLRSDTIRLVQNGCSFHGLRSEDPNQHLKDFLKLVDSLNLDGENKERKRLRLFQFSLRDEASNWLERLLAGSITTWEDLTTRFLDQFFPSGRTAKLHNDILMFQQHHGESLSEAWTRFKDLLKKVPHHEGLVSEFMASQDASLSKFEADFKQYQSKMTNKIDTVLKAIIYRIAGILPSDTVNNLKLSAALVLLGDSKPFDTLADLGSCVNIIPLYLFKKLNIGLLEETDYIFRLADRTKSYPVGIVKDVEVHIGKQKLLNDFYVIDMKKDPETPLLVGRGFLATANTIIDCRMDKITVGEGITRKDFLDCHFPGEWEISRDVELNPFKDTLVFKRMVEFLGAIPINLMCNMWESKELIKKLINWDKPPKNEDGAWHAKIRLIDTDGEKFTKTLQSIPTTRKLSERESLREIIDLDHFYDT